MGQSESKIWENGKKRERKLQEKVKKTRSGKNLIGIYEISPDPVVISSDSMRFRWIRWDFARFAQNFVRSTWKSAWIWVLWPRSRFFIARIWVFISGIWNFLVGIWISRRIMGFRPSVRVFRVFGERNWNWPARVSFWWRKSVADCRSRSGRSVSGRFRSGLRVDRVTGYVWIAHTPCHK